MRIAYNQATCKERSSLDRDVRLCVQHGIREIELRFDMIDRYLKDHTPQQMRALFADGNVRPITLNAIFNINFLDASGRESIGAQMRRACALGELLDIHCVIVLPSDCNADGRHSEAEIFRDSVSNLKWLAEIGRDCGMKIAFEPIGARARCVRSIAQAWEIVRATGDPRIGLALDAYNLYQYRRLEDVGDIASVDPERIFIVHINDAVPEIMYDRLGSFDRSLPGDGCIDLRPFVEQLENAGYQGPYSVEVLNPSLWEIDPDVLFESAVQKTRAVLAACAEEKSHED